MADMLSLEEAQARTLALAPLLPVERSDVAGTLGRYLVEPLLARRTQPAAHVSAMDGYAVRADDRTGPWRLAGESSAGHPYENAVNRGEAVRISTGAILPADCDVVIVQEDTARDGDRVLLSGQGPEPADRHIRRAGADFRHDCELLPAGTRMGPTQIALAITAGHKHLAVRRAPRIAVIDGGDELASDPELCPAHQIPASNGAMLAALARSVPSEITRIGPVPDDLDALIAALDLAGNVDLIVTTGGASVGDHDLIRPALERWGATIDFWRVGIKPGKPILVARKGAQLVLSLPGNPVSSFVTAYLFMLPLLRIMLGATHPLPRSLSFPSATALPPTRDRREFVRAHFTETGVAPVSTQDSGALAALAATECLIERPALSAAIAPGASVPVYLLENGGLA